MGTTGPIRLDRPEEGDIVKFHEDFYFEIGKNDFFKFNDEEKGHMTDTHVDLRLDAASSTFDYRKDVRKSRNQDRVQNKTKTKQKQKRKRKKESR